MLEGLIGDTSVIGAQQGVVASGSADFHPDYVTFVSIFLLLCGDSATFLLDRDYAPNTASERIRLCGFQSKSDPASFGMTNLAY